VCREQAGRGGREKIFVGDLLVVQEEVLIVCYKKVVRMPLEGDEIFRVYGERTLGAAKALMNTKVDEPRISDTPVSKEEHEVHLKLVLKSLRKEKLYAKFFKLGDALSRKERVKSRRVKGMILAAQIEAFKQENVPLVGSKMDEAHASRYLVHPGADKTYYNLRDMYCLRYMSENEIESPWILSLNFQDSSKEWNSGDDQLRLRWMNYLMVLADAAESVRDVIRFEYCLASSSGWTNIRCAPFEALYGRKCKPPVIWAEIGGSSLIRPKLVQETTDKVTPWKGVVHFGKKGKLAPRYVGPFEILERIGLVAYRLRLPEELNSVHDTFHVSNLKKCLADANLHVLLNEIKIDKTLRFIEEPVEIMDRGIRSLKRSKISLVKVHWNSKRGSEFTWEREDHMKSKYPQLFVDNDVESGGSPAGIHGLFSGRYCGLVGRMVTLRVSTAGAKGVTTGTLIVLDVACLDIGKSKKKTHKPKSEDTNQEKLYLLHIDLCGPMRVATVNGKKYILVIVDDYSRFTWVMCLRSKDEAPDFIIKILKMIQIGISHETFVARFLQQNGVVERRNHTLIEAARTMLIYAKALLFSWAEAVATACYTQNHSMIRLHHGKTPYELLHNKPSDLSFLHVFGALCYPTNDRENLGKLQPKADIGIFIGYAPTKKAFRVYN
ncbi:retrovirus-related pol polyprotein from transposon TNT 1-94, partial [Tanacetum coccineum]